LCAWKQARRNKGGYVIKDELLYHIERRCGQTINALCVPQPRRLDVLKLAHNNAHFGIRHTKERIISSGLWWPTIAGDTQKYVAECVECQLRARKTWRDRVPIRGTLRDPDVWHYFYMDCAGPIVPNANLRYNYVLVLIDSCSRYPFAYPLRSLSAKNVCSALMCMFQTTGIPIGMTIASDNGSNFRAALTRELMSRLGVSPVFSTPYHPVSVVERSIQTLKNTIAKMAYDHKDSWVNYLGPSLWAIRSTVNESVGCPPHLLVFGHMPRGPLSILSETWTGNVEISPNLSKTAVEYLDELKSKLETAQHYASVCAEREQNRHIQHYNLKAQDKTFTPGDSCLILQPESTSSHALRRWKGPAKIIQVLSPYSYLVDYNGTQYRMHANNLRKFNVRVCEIKCESMSVSLQYESDNVESVKSSENSSSCNCAVVYDQDVDFGELVVIDPPSLKREVESLPSHKITPEKLSHLTSLQQKELLEVLDRYHNVFSEIPGLCIGIEHRIPIRYDFQPKRLKAYKVPEHLRDEVARQIRELEQLGFIEKSISPMASPIVCVLKAQDKDGKRGLRIAIDYKYVNKFTEPSVAPLEDINDLVQQVGASNYISLFDAKSGYHQCVVKEEDRWLTSFICDEGQFQWTRMPFGMRSSGTTFSTAIKEILRSIRDFTKSYVDDMAVHSTSWQNHLLHLDQYLSIVQASGLTLGLKKSEFAKPEVKFIGHLIGSGQRRVDPEKLDVINNLKEPETKKQLRTIIGIFSFFRDYIPNFAFVAKPLTDLTSKRVSDRIPFGQRERDAFCMLKLLLCQAVNEPLDIVDHSRQLSLFVDASEIAVGAALTQCDTQGRFRPVAFASSKLTPTQQRWSTIEREAYAALWALQKYKYWIFGTRIILYSDHNPITFLTEATPKSSKLMRWSLALQEFDVEFRYRSGKLNEAADCLSRMVQSND